MKNSISIILSCVFVVLSLLHFYWAAGGKWGLQNSLPIDENGQQILNPSALATVIVALGLLAMAIVYLVHADLLSNPLLIKISNVAIWIIPAIFTLRAIGDFKYIGFFKAIKGTDFAYWDTILYSPLCLIISILGMLVLKMK